MEKAAKQPQNVGKSGVKLESDIKGEPDDVKGEPDDVKDEPDDVKSESDAKGESDAKSQLEIKGRELKGQELDKKMEEIKKLIQRAEEIIKQQSAQLLEVKSKSKSLTIFLGGTGAGKSTLINFLSHPEHLTVEKGKIALKPGATGPKIGSSRDSQTELPELVDLDETHVLCDLPGFGDTRGTMQCLINALMTKKIIEAAPRVHLVFVTSSAEIVSGRGDRPKKTVEQAQNLLPKVKSVTSISSLIVTRVEQWYESKEAFSSWFEEDAPTELSGWKQSGRLEKMLAAKIDEKNREEILSLLRTGSFAEGAAIEVNIEALYDTKEKDLIDTLCKQIFKEIVDQVIRENFQETEMKTLSLQDLFAKKNFFNDKFASVVQARVESSLLLPLLGTLSKDRVEALKRDDLELLILEQKNRVLSKLSDPILISATAEYYHTSYINAIETSITGLNRIRDRLDRYLHKYKILHTGTNLTGLAGTALVLVPLLSLAPIIGGPVIIAGGSVRLVSGITATVFENHFYSDIIFVLELEAKAQQQLIMSIERKFWDWMATHKADMLGSTSAAINVTVNATHIAHVPKLVAAASGKIAGNIALTVLGQSLVAVGAAMNVVDLVMAWTVSNETLEKIDQLIAEKEATVNRLRAEGPPKEEDFEKIYQQMLQRGSEEEKGK